MFGKFSRAKSVWSKIAFGVCAFLAVLLLAQTFAIYVTQGPLDERFDKFREAGLATTVEELPGPPIPDAENAALPLGRAAGMAKALLQSLRAKPGLQSLGEDPGDPAAAAAVTAAVSATSLYELELQRADLLRRYRSPSRITRPYPSIKLSYLTDYREIAQLETIRCRGLANQGKHNEGLQLMLRQLRLLQKIEGNEPWLMGFNVVSALRLVAIDEINRLLRSQSIPSDLRDRLDADLALIEQARRDLGRVLHPVILMSHWMYQEYLPLKNCWPFRAISNNDELFSIDSIRTQIELLDQPYAEAAMDFSWRDAMLHEKHFNRLRYIGTLTLLPAVRIFRQGLEKLIARTRSLRILNAMQRQTAPEPALESLNLPKYAITDPFSGAPMRVVWKPSGVVIYSVGEDGRDDGGQLDDRQQRHDYGVGPIENK